MATKKAILDFARQQVATGWGADVNSLSPAAEAAAHGLAQQYSTDPLVHYEMDRVAAGNPGISTADASKYAFNFYNTDSSNANIRDGAQRVWNGWGLSQNGGFTPSAVAAVDPAAAAVAKEQFDQQHQKKGPDLGQLALMAAGSYFGAPFLGSALGIGSTAAGALAGGITSGLTGGNPLLGAAGGYFGGAGGAGGVTDLGGGLSVDGWGNVVGGSGINTAGSMLPDVAGNTPWWQQPMAGGVSDTGWGANTVPGIMGNGGTTALETGSTGGNMGFFDSILGSDPWGAGVADPALSVGEMNVPNYTANVLDQVAPGTASATGNSAWDTFLNGGSGVLGGGAGGFGGGGSTLDAIRTALAAKSALGGFSPGSGTKGGSILDQITGNPLGSAFNALPFGLALMQANSQKNDIAPYIQNLNNLASQYGGNQQSYLNALTDPYDQSTGVNRQRLMESLNQRGVAGSSFGDQAINNFDYTAGLGRADLLGKGIAQGAQTGAGINTQAINAINARNLSSNALIGAGLNASGQLFNPVQNDQFNLKNLFGVAV